MEKTDQEILPQTVSRIEDWKSRLIDLSRKNNLLYFRRTKSGNLSISRPNAEAVFNSLILRHRHWEFWLPPDEPDSPDGQLLLADSPLLPEGSSPKANQLVCEGVVRKDLERILKNLARRSLSDYRERGVRILHAAFGMLVWKEIETSEEVRSPLILVPLELTRESVHEPFTIKVPPVEEETILNPALQVKMKKDFKIDLPPLPEDWESQSLTSYLSSITELVNKHGWKVEETAEVGLFSFHKLVIYKDLESNSELIAQNPLIRAITGDKSVRLTQDSLPDEKDVDKTEPPQETFQVLDADSSQRVSIDYALRGQSFVMQGPPGTGKSQTIANIIAECIARGKSVLFVSDKMAALEVVYKRLSEVGLAHFCLELHSDKANKREVLAELKRCLEEQYVPRKLPSSHEFEKMTRLREQLNDYVASLHLKRQPLDKSAYEILGQISNLERVPFVPVGLKEPRSLTPQRVREFEELMSQVKNVWQVVEDRDFPWRGYRGDMYSIEIRSELSALLDSMISTIEMLKSESARLSEQLGLSAPSTLDQTKWLIGLGNFLLESPRPEMNWVVSPDVDRIISEATNYHAVCEWCRKTRSSLMENYEQSLFNLVLGTSSELEDVLQTVGKTLNSSTMKEGELLKKREDLLEFVKKTQMLAKSWDENAQELAKVFGLSTENLTIERVSQLSRLAILCFSEDKPELRWLNPKYLQALQEMLPKTKKDYEERNSLRSRLEQIYSEGIFKLDLAGLIIRYSGPYKSFLKWLRPSFHRDQKQIAMASRDGHVSKSVLSDLLDIQRLKTLEKDIEANAESVRSMLGHFYKGYETDFKKTEKAVEIAAEVFRLSKVTQVPENLTKLASYGSDPLPPLKQKGDELQESVSKWEQTLKELSSLVPVYHLPNSNLPIYQTPLPELQKWTTETESRLLSLSEKTNEVLKTCKREAPQNYSRLLEDLRNAENVRIKEAEILDKKESLKQEFGFRYVGLETNWEEILSILQWTKKVQAYFDTIPIPELFASVVSRGATSAPSNSDVVKYYDEALKLLATLESRFETELIYQGKKLQGMEIESIHGRIKSLRERVDDLQVWMDFKDIKTRFLQAGLDSFFGRLSENPPPASQLVDVFLRAAYQEWINSVYDEDPCLGRFRRENHEQLIADFRKLDEELIRLSSYRVIQAVNSKKPQGILIQAGDSEVNTLLKEAAKKRRIMPIRNLLQRIPHILFRLKPCLLMSPISVSQFLGPELRFDMVLFDEASQIVPEDAIGSIYRGKAIVVAGDEHQLPPTTFFQKGMIEDYDWDEISDDESEVFDSILDEFHGIGLPVKTLRWHYRSKHEGLISFSNHRFYEDTLITFPSAVAKSENLGVKLVYVADGVYDRGGKRDNLREAQVVSDLVFEHFKHYPNKTLGVVTFSMAQMEAVDEAILLHRKEHPEYERFFKEDRLEGFFVKNLENVQGDERDVMIFSIGYGRDQKGQMSLNFGPLNKPGGERRLNVAVTRAREKVILVTSIKASDIDLNATSALGVITLCHYLEYAERGPDALKLKPQFGEFESVLEEDVAGEIRRMGYDVAPQVGCSGNRIDIGVIDPTDPGRFILGIECDGPTYRSSYSARDRDRLREQVLKRLGWKVYRVWAPTWAARHESEVRRLKEALEQANNPPPQDATLKEKDDPIELKEPPSKEMDLQKVQFDGIEKIGVPYKVHVLKARYPQYVTFRISRYPYRSTRKNEFHFECNRELLIGLLTELVRNEGPIHFNYAVQRLAATWGIRRTGHKVVLAAREAADACLRDGRMTLKGRFLWPVGLREVIVRVPVEGVSESVRKPEYIPPEEIESAMKLVAQYALGISAESLVVETARVFGFDRIGEKVKERFSEVYKELLKQGKLTCTNDIVTIPQP